MLKRLLVTVAFIGVTAASYGQGTVVFDNGTSINNGAGARVLLAAGLPGGRTTVDGNAPTGAVYRAQLFSGAAGATEGSLAAVGDQTPFRLGINGGFVVADDQAINPFTGQNIRPTVDVVGTGGAAATIQLRAWDARFNTYAEALAAGAPNGKSPLLALAKTGIGGAGGTPAVPLEGLQGFTIVPEPTTIALGALGLAALLFRRRK